MRGRGWIRSSRRGCGSGFTGRRGWRCRAGRAWGWGWGCSSRGRSWSGTAARWGWRACQGRDARSGLRCRWRPNPLRAGRFGQPGAIPGVGRANDWLGGAQIGAGAGVAVLDPRADVGEVERAAAAAVREADDVRFDAPRQPFERLAQLVVADDLAGARQHGDEGVD